MNPEEETQKIEHAGYPSIEDAVHGEPDEEAVPFPPVTTSTGTTYTRPFGLILSFEVTQPGITTYGDMLNAIAAAWRGREELAVKPGADGGIRDEQRAPVGLWMIDYA